MEIRKKATFLLVINNPISMMLYTISSNVYFNLSETKIHRNFRFCKKCIVKLRAQQIYTNRHMLKLVLHKHLFSI